MSTSKAVDDAEANGSASPEPTQSIEINLGGESEAVGNNAPGATAKAGNLSKQEHEEIKNVVEILAVLKDKECVLRYGFYCCC